MFTLTPVRHGGDSSLVFGLNSPRIQSLEITGLTGSFTGDMTSAGETIHLKNGLSIQIGDSEISIWADAGHILNEASREGERYLVQRVSLL